jgi:hypothetical protein
MKTAVFLSVVLAFDLSRSSGGVFGQQTVDFATALNLARKNNPDWRAAEQEVEISRGESTQARLITPFNPVVEGQSGRRSIPREGKGADYGLGLSMEIEVAGQRGLRIAEAERNFKEPRLPSRTLREPSPRSLPALFTKPFTQGV